MPYKRKDNGVYYSDFESRSGKRVRKSLRTLELNVAKIKEAELISKDQGEYVPVNSNRKTWREAVARYWTEVKGKTTAEDIQRYLRYLDQFLGNKFLDEIDDELVEDIIAAKSSEITSSGKQIAGATVNRYTTTLKAVLNRARDRYKWIAHVPYVRKFEESKGRTRYLTPDEAKRLLEECKDHLKPIVTFALHTGLRRGNVLKLKWENVDLEQGKCWVQSTDHKNRTSRGVPLNSVALGVLRKLAIDKVSPYVFNYRGKPVKTVKEAYNGAVARAGLKDVTFHTLRHTYASWLAQQNVSMLALKELGGWKTIEMAQRYSHYGDEGLKEYQELLVGVSQNHDTVASPKLKLVKA